MRSNHPIFKRYPLDGEISLCGETLSTPYHIYDGAMLLLGGTADAAVASKLLSDARMLPLLDENGRALAAVWVGDFTEASLGAHHELQISLFATARPIPRLTPHPFAILRALTVIPETRMVCHGLWNNTRRVVRYNAEHLRLDARFASSEIACASGQWQFRFNNEEGSMIAQGTLDMTVRQSATAMWQMIRHIGVQGLMRSIRSPFIHVPVTSTCSQFAGQDLVADTYTQSDRQVIRRFGSQDRLKISHPMYACLGFAADFVQQIQGVRFVYLRPQPEQAGAARPA